MTRPLQCPKCGWIYKRMREDKDWSKCIIPGCDGIVYRYPTKRPKLDSRNAKGEATYAVPDRFPPVPLPKP